MKPVIYMDTAAATPVAAEVLAAMQPYFSELFYNPSALYWAAHEVLRQLQTSRETVAQLLGARPSEVVFTAGGTEANNLAIHGVMQRFPGKDIVVSSIEHDSVLAPAGQYDCRTVPVRPDGRLEVAEIERAIDDDTVLVSIQYANNEIGTIQPIHDIALALKDIRVARQAKSNKLPLYFHTDAAQAANYLDLHVSRLGVDLLSLNGGKIYGPKQSGLLYIRAGVQLAPLMQGGGQERNVRSGTENVPGIIGFSTALSLAQQMRKAEAERLKKLQDLFFAEVTRQLPQAVINGSRSHRLPNNVHLTLPGSDNERLLIELDQRGILAAAGSACSASSETPSHVLKALGLSDAEAQASLRFTMGRMTTEDMVRQTVAALADLIA